MGHVADYQQMCASSDKSDGMVVLVAQEEPLLKADIILSAMSAITSYCPTTLPGFVKVCRQ